MYFYTSFSRYVCVCTVLTKTSDDVSLQRGASRADKDSMMMYTGLCKATAKPTGPHALQFHFLYVKSMLIYSISRLLLYSNTGFELT